MRILVADHDEQVTTLLAESLTAQRYLVDTVNDGQVAWEFIESTAYELVLLDVMLSNFDGISLCRRLRERGYQMPVLLLTAHDSTPDKILGLDAGADDYVMKPFDLGELTARLRALLRRGGLALPPVLEWGCLRLDPGICKVTYAEQPVPLSPKEYSLLEFFLRHGRRVFSRSAILEHLWAFEEPPTEDTVKAHIKGIRQKLKAVGAPTDLIETVYGLGYRLKPPSLPAAPEPSLAPQSLEMALAKVWERSRETVSKRVGVLESSTRALLGGTLTLELRQQTEQQARKLAGLLGPFGLHEGTRLAHLIEEQIKTPLQEPEQILHFTELVVALRRELERTTPVQAALMPCSRPVIMVISSDTGLVDLLQAADLKRDWIICQDLARAGQLIAEQKPNAILLDLPEASLAYSATLALLAEFVTGTAPIPFLVLDNTQDLAERVELTRLGSRAILPKSLSPQAILAVLEQVLDPIRTAPRVLLVDDDRQLLIVLQRILEPWGLKLATLAEPLRFLEILETFRPDLLVLDVAMPDLNGIDLCRVVRSDPRWQGLPILFLTAHADADTVQRVFASGADDLVSKPVTGPELAIRILNRLERTRLLRN